MEIATESRGRGSDGRLASYTVNARYAAFAGHRGIVVRDLSIPDDRIYRIRYETGRPRFNAVLAFSPVRLNFLAVANGSQILIFDVAARKTHRTLKGNGRIVNSICFATANPSTLVTGAVDGSFCVWSLEESSRPLHHIRGLIGACSNVAVSHSNTDHLAICHKGKVSVWSLPCLRPVAVMKSKTPTLELLSWCPTVPHSIAGISSSGGMTIWDVRDALNASKLPTNSEKDDEDDEDDHAMFGEPEDMDSAPCSTLQLGYPISQVQLLGHRGVVVLPCRGNTLFFYAYNQERSDFTELWRLSLDATIECFTLRETGTIVKTAACFRDMIQEYNVPTPVLDGMGWSETKPSTINSPHIQKHGSPKVTASLRSDATMRPEPPLPRKRSWRKLEVASKSSPVNVAGRERYSYKPSRFITSNHKPHSLASPPRSMNSSLELPTKHALGKEDESPMPFLSPTIPARQTVPESIPSLDESLRFPPLGRASFDSLVSSSTLDNDSDSDDETFAGNMRSSGLQLPGGVNVPLPRTCGASFGQNGQLCTFFPFRARPTSFMEEVEVMDSGKVGTHISDAARLFPTFGNLAATLRTHDDSDTDSVASLKEFVGENSQSVLQPASFESRPSWKAKVSPIKASSRPLTEEHSVNVAVHEVETLLPGRKALAMQYRLMTQADESDAQLCSNNATVAAEEGLSGVADAWRALALMLESAPLLDVVHKGGRNCDVGMVCHRPAMSRSISAISEAGDEIKGADTFQSQYGDHPLGKAWAIERILRWAEHRADVQTLACTSALIAQAVGRKAADLRVPPPGLEPDVLTSKLLELEVPSDISAFHQQSSALGMVEESPLKPSLSHTSSRDPSQPPTPFLNSSANTPPLSFSAASRQSARLFTSGSASPEQHQRSSFGAAAKYYAQTISDKFSSYGSSPPTRKSGTSPGNELSSSLPTATGSWSKSVSFASNLGPAKDETRRGSLKQEDNSYDSDRTVDDASLPRTPKMPPSGVIFKKTNAQDAFFDELGTNPPRSCRAEQMLGRGALWCKSYSEQLRSWDFLVEAAELDNIHKLAESSDMTSSSAHAAILPEPVTGKARAVCAICYCVIRGAEQLCPACFHTSHPNCLEQLIAGMGERLFTCPTGCGCDCSEVSELRLEITENLHDIPRSAPPFKKKSSFTDPRRLRLKLQGESW